MSTLSKARVAELAAEIRTAGRMARETDPATRGRVSYPALCGGLQATIRHFVRTLAGDAAAAEIDAAFADAYAAPAPAGSAA